MIHFERRVLAETVATGVIAIASVELALLVGLGGFDAAEWGFLLVMAAGTYLAARCRWVYLPAAGVVALVTLVTFGIFAALLWEADPPAFVPVWLTGAIVFAVLAGGAYAALWGSRFPGAWAWGAAATGSAVISLASGLTPDPWWGAWSVSWWAVAVMGAVIYALAAWPLIRGRGRGRGTSVSHDRALAALLAAATYLLALALGLGLDPAWVGMGWALQLAALGGLWRWLRVASLKWQAGAVALAVIARMVLNPFVLEYPVSPQPILNALLLAYGVSVAAAVAARWLFTDTEPEADASRFTSYPRQLGVALHMVLEVLAGALGLVGLTLLVVHATNGGALMPFEPDFYAWAVLANVYPLAGLGVVLLGWLGRWVSQPRVVGDRVGSESRGVRWR